MASNTGKFTLRTETDILGKIHYIASYNGRSSNREIEILIKHHIAEFEKENGPIILPQKEDK